MACYSLWLACVTILISDVHSAKILLLPYPFYSHVTELTDIGESLYDHGHAIHLMLPPTFPRIQQFKRSPKLRVIEYAVKLKDFNAIHAENLEANHDDFIDRNLRSSPVETLRENIKGNIEVCINPLEDTGLHDRLRAAHYDLALVDGFFNTRCYYILLYKLGIPYVSVTTTPEPWLSRTPAFPSVVPFVFKRPAPNPEMTFWERLSNLYSLLDWTVFPGMPFLDDDLVRRYAPEKPHVTLNWLAGQSLLWLINTDIAVDFVRPTMPNEINIGGMSTRPGNLPSSDVIADKNAGNPPTSDSMAFENVANPPSHDAKPHGKASAVIRHGNSGNLLISDTMSHGNPGNFLPADDKDRVISGKPTASDVTSRAKMGNTIPSDVIRFMDSAQEGVIVVSFGSFVILPVKYAVILAEAFSSINQSVILRYIQDKKHPVTFSSNVKVLTWLSQNDLLSHKSVKLFITHAGANSQFEGLYHAVPMLNLPLFGDHYYDASRGDYKGYSRTLSLLKLEAISMVSSIEELIYNDSYRRAIKKGSEIFKSAPMNPRERAVYWIEHVLKFGGDHLHSDVLDIPWYEYFVLDIIATILVLMLCSLISIGLMWTFFLKLFKIFIKKCRRSRKRLSTLRGMV